YTVTGEYVSRAATSGQPGVRATLYLQQGNGNSMTIVRCPRCRDDVTVPSGATVRALVRCPLCLEQYLLAEALANAPPLLVIIGGEVADEAIERLTEIEEE